MLIDLGAIINNRPDDADFLRKLELGYNQTKPFSYDPQKNFTTQLDSQGHTSPYFSFIPYEQLSTMLGTLTTAIKMSHNLPLSGLIEVIQHEYPELQKYLHQLGYSDAVIETLMIQALLKNTHSLENAPVVETTPQMFGLLARCNESSSIPATHFRSPYITCYFDYSNVDLDERVMIANESIVDGCYLHVCTCEKDGDPAVRNKMLSDDKSTKRAIEKGLIDINDTNDLYTLLFICHNKNTGSLEEIKFSFVVSRNLDVSIHESIIALQPDESEITKQQGDIFYSEMAEAVGLVANQCLYMVSQPLDRVLLKERSDLYIALKRTHNTKKKRQIQKKLDVAKDCVRIGTQYYLDRDSDAIKRVLLTSKRDPQLRRGHFKSVRYGVGRTEKRIVFVSPYWTGKGSTTKPVKVIVQ